MMHVADRLLSAVQRCGAPLCVGLDPVVGKLPAALQTVGATKPASAIESFSLAVLAACARVAPVVLWTAPGWLYWVTAALMLPAMILLVAGNLPGSRIKQRVGHPMLLSVKVWATAHLLVNGGLHDLLLFGGFLIWAVPDFIRLRRRDRANGTVYATRGPARDALVLGLGVLAYALLVGGLHLWLVGVRPLPG
jgi:uncharacterized membrane protein